MPFASSRALSLPALLASGVLLGLSACGQLASSAGADVHGADSDAGGASNGDPPSATSAGRPAGKGEAGSSSSVNTGEGGASGAAEDTCKSALPSAPSRQTVTFTIRNDTTSERFVVLSGAWCDAFSISSAGVPVPIELGFQCLCECPRPDSGPAGLQRVAPNGTVTLTWDARELTTCATPVDCKDEGWPNAGSPPRLTAIHRPVSAGTYEVHVRSFADLPADCHSQDGVNYRCVDRYSYRGATLPPVIQELCDSPTAGAPIDASASFVVPSTGDVTVMVSLN